MFTKQDIEKYFLAEKQLGLIFVIVGAVAVVLAVIFLLALKTNFYKGAAIPLIVLGLLQLIAGFTVYKRSDEDRIRNVYAYDMNPGQLKSEELPRIQNVVKKFAAIKWVEIILMVAGVFLLLYFRSDETKAFWVGLGITLALMTTITFIADYTAEKRAVLYKNGLESFLKK
ncbi:MAG: hypothetical protein QM726_02740 [Chitinophagaceae bacterium]